MTIVVNKFKNSLMNRENKNLSLRLNDLSDLAQKVSSIMDQIQMELLNLTHGSSSSSLAQQEFVQEHEQFEEEPHKYL